MIPCTLLTHPVSAARKALTMPVGSDVGVPIVEEMAVLAVSLSGVASDGTLASQDIFPMHNWFEMVGVDACRISAKVVEIQSGRKSPVEEPIHQSMDANLFPFDADVRVAISSARQNARPDPTATVLNLNRHHEYSTRFTPQMGGVMFPLRYLTQVDGFGRVR